MTIISEIYLRLNQHLIELKIQLEILTLETSLNILLNYLKLLRISLLNNLIYHII